MKGIITVPKIQTSGKIENIWRNESLMVLVFWLFKNEKSHLLVNCNQSGFMQKAY